MCGNCSQSNSQSERSMSLCHIFIMCPNTWKRARDGGMGRSLIALSQPCECYKQNSIHLDSRGQKKYVSNGYLKGWTNKTWDLITDRCFSHLSAHSVGSQVSYSQYDLERSTLWLASVFVLSACMCTSVCVCVCVGFGGVTIISCCCLSWLWDMCWLRDGLGGIAFR